MNGEYPVDCELAADTHVGKTYEVYRGVEVTVCGVKGSYGEIRDLDPKDWYQHKLVRDDMVTVLELSDVFDPLVQVHGENVVGWIPTGALVLSSIDNF